MEAARAAACMAAGAGGESNEGAAAATTTLEPQAHMPHADQGHQEPPPASTPPFTLPPMARGKRSPRHSRGHRSTPAGSPPCSAFPDGRTQAPELHPSAQQEEGVAPSPSQAHRGKPASFAFMAGRASQPSPHSNGLGLHVHQEELQQEEQGEGIDEDTAGTQPEAGTGSRKRRAAGQGVDGGTYLLPTTPPGVLAHGSSTETAVQLQPPVEGAWAGAAAGGAVPGVNGQVELTDSVQGEVITEAVWPPPLTGLQGLSSRLCQQAGAVLGSPQSQVGKRVHRQGGAQPVRLEGLEGRPVWPRPGKPPLCPQQPRPAQPGQQQQQQAAPPEQQGQGQAQEVYDAPQVEQRLRDIANLIPGQDLVKKLLTILEHVATG
jgi:hypothetical protein